MARRLNIVIFLIIISFGLILVLHFYDFYIVDSKSMEDTISEGDHILVLKPNLLFRESKLSRNQVLLFYSPLDSNDILVKRCIGIPGDTIKIINSNVFINGISEPASMTIKNYYKVYYSNQETLGNYLKENNIEFEFQDNQDNVLLCNLNKSQSLYLSINKTIVDSLEVATRIDAQDSWVDLGCIISNTHPDSVLTVCIPSKGDTLTLEDQGSGSKHYEESLFVLNYTLNELVRKNSTIGESKFVVQEDLYLLIGDNRQNSIDSRCFGLIPRKNIIGRAMFVIRKSSPGVIEENRFFLRL